MPELPELQAHAERLDERYAGAHLTRFTPLTFTALKTAVPPTTEAHGHDLMFVGRRGKYLLFDFGTLTFVVHLMQGGRIKEEGAGKQPTKPKQGLARWVFDDERALLTEAGTERKAGVWAVAGDPEGQVPLDGLGPDANTVDPPHLLTLLHERPMRLHGFLRDQHGVAGLGRRLANEICHRAKLSPYVSTAKLTIADAEGLVEAIHASINESLAYERGRDNMSASADRPGSVHHREGDACPVCRDTIRAVEYRSYSIDYCPTCQTGGKILADNTTSKFSSDLDVDSTTEGGPMDPDELERMKADAAAKRLAHTLATREKQDRDIREGRLQPASTRGRGLGSYAEEALWAQIDHLPTKELSFHIVFDPATGEVMDVWTDYDWEQRGVELTPSDKYILEQDLEASLADGRAGPRAAKIPPR